MSVGEAPAQVSTWPCARANLVGSGLYGVDLKQVEDRCYLIEVNCNPNIDAGVEDEASGDALYREVVGVFARRIAERRAGALYSPAAGWPKPGDSCNFGAAAPRHQRRLRRRSACTRAQAFVRGSALDAASGAPCATSCSAATRRRARAHTLSCSGLPERAAKRVLLVGLGPSASSRGRLLLRAPAPRSRRCDDRGRDATICLIELPVEGPRSCLEVEQAVLRRHGGAVRFDRSRASRPRNAR
jgi:hypothetical protein